MTASIQSLQRTVSHLRHLLRPRPTGEYAEVTYNQFLALHNAVDYMDRNKKILDHSSLEQDHDWIIHKFPSHMQYYLQYLTTYNHPSSPFAKPDCAIKNFDLVRHTYFPALHAQPQVISHYLYTKKLYYKVNENCEAMLKQEK